MKNSYMKSVLLCILMCGQTFFGQTGIINTVAGTGQVGGQGSNGDGGPATSATFSYIYDVASGHGGRFYVSDGGYIRLVDPAGIITTMGNLNGGRYVACDKKGNLYFGGLWKRDTLGNVTHLAGGGSTLGDGGPATSAMLTDVTDVAFDTMGNIFLCDNGAHRIRKINSSGIITTYAGNGTTGYSGDGGAATSAQLHYPYRVACDQAGNVYIADSYNNVIRKVNTSGIISTVAGNGYGAGTGGNGAYSGDNGPATSAELNFPIGLTVDPQNRVIIGDFMNARVRMVDLSGIITTIAGGGQGPGIGDGGPATNAALNPNGLDYDKFGNLFISDYGTFRVREVFFGTNEIVSYENAPGIYPNPMVDQLHISNLEKNSLVSILDVQGRVLESVTVSSTSLDLNVAFLPQGVYILECGKSHKKLVKE